jgi:ribosomal protein S18 acetylase RimI-like enzyme
LGVWENNHPAIAFYEHLGFEAFDEHTFRFGDEEQRDLLMRLTVEAMPPREARMDELVVRTALVSDAPAISAIGSVAFPAIHADLVGPAYAAAVVEQTYSVDALAACIRLCTAAANAEFLVAERDGEVIGYLHYDSEGAEPELHRLYVHPDRKRGGVGRALVDELHDRLGPGAEYVLLVAEANTDAQAFYEWLGLVVERRIDGPQYYSAAMAIETDAPPPAAVALLMRYRPGGL